MGDPQLQAILEVALDIEKEAQRFYSRLGEGLVEETERAFWQELARQEGDHVAYWDRLIDLAKENKIRNLFETPDRVLSELEEVKERCLSIAAESPIQTTPHALYVAVRLEFYVLHPAFGALFHLYAPDVGGHSPEADYDLHLHYLISGFDRFAQGREETRLIGQMLQTLWAFNRMLAHRLADVNTLRGLIPICMHCKKVRNEKGYWIQVERYVSEHSEAEFSHGLCEDCLKKFYPEFG